MKKVLFATTALVFTAGFAAAEVAVTGSAEMGVFGGSGEATIGGVKTESDTDLQFHTDVDLRFTLSGETDGGVEFGATFDLDEAALKGGKMFAADKQGGEAIFIKGAGGKLTLGDTDGAFDWALSENTIGGSINDDNEHLGYNGLSGLDGTYDGQIVRYEFSYAGFGIALSGEMDDSGEGDPVVGLGLKYNGSFGDTEFGLGLGYQTISEVSLDGVENIATGDQDFDVVGVSVDTNILGGAFVANYVDFGGATTELELAGQNLGTFAVDSYYGIALGYDLAPYTVAFNYGKHELANDAGDASGYGLVGSYDLGGGAELQAGWGHSEVDLSNGNEAEADTYSLGMAMSF